MNQQNYGTFDRCLKLLKPCLLGTDESKKRKTDKRWSGYKKRAPRGVTFENSIYEFYKENVQFSLSALITLFLRIFPDTGLYVTGWTRIAIWSSTQMLHPKMVELCNKANKAAGKNGTVAIADLDDQAMLTFINRDIPPIGSIYVVNCFLTPGVSESYDTEANDDENHHHQHNSEDLDHHDSEDTEWVWYIGRGTRDDCVFYLDKISFLGGYRKYILEKEVCGIEEISNELEN